MRAAAPSTRRPPALPAAVFNDPIASLPVRAAPPAPARRGPNSTGIPFTRHLLGDLASLAAPARIKNFALNPFGVTPGMIQHPLRTAEQAVQGTRQQYSNIAHHPLRAFIDHPLYTGLAVAPVGAPAGFAAREELAASGLLGRGAWEAARTRELARQNLMIQQLKRQATVTQRKWEAHLASLEPQRRAALEQFRNEIGQTMPQSMLPKPLPAAPPSVQQFLQAIVRYEAVRSHKGMKVPPVVARQVLDEARLQYRLGVSSRSPRIQYAFNRPGAANLSVSKTFHTDLMRLLTDQNRVDPGTFGQIMQNPAENVWLPLRRRRG